MDLNKARRKDFEKISTEGLEIFLCSIENIIYERSKKKKNESKRN